LGLLTPIRDKRRHVILSKLVAQLNNVRDVDSFHFKDISIPLIEVAQSMDISDQELMLCCSKMIENKEIVFKDWGRTGKGKGQEMYAGEQCMQSFADKKYIKDGNTFVISRIKDYIGIPSALLGFISIVIATCNTVAVSRNKEKVERVTVKTDTIQAQIKRAGLK